MSADRAGFVILLLVMLLIPPGCRRSEPAPTPANPPAPAPAPTPVHPPQPTTPPAGTEATGMELVDSNDRTYTVRFASRPSPIPLNELFQLEVIVRRAAQPDQPLSGVTLAADAAMPAHQHGMNTQPEVRDLGGGRFMVEGMLFHMSGDWELYFDITAGPVTERAQCNVHLE